MEFHFKAIRKLTICHQLTLRKKAQLLLLLLRSLPFLTNHFGGFFPFLQQVFGYFLSRGIRGAAGKLISLVCYLFSDSNYFYDIWVKNESASQLIQDSPLLLCLDGEYWQGDDLDNFRSHLAALGLAADVFVIDTSAKGSVLNTFKNKLQNNVVALYLRYPCELSANLPLVSDFFSKCENDFLFFDYDQILEGRRENPCFKPGVDPLLFGYEAYSCCFLFKRSSFSGLEAFSLLDAERYGCKFSHVPKILVHWRHSFSSWVKVDAKLGGNFDPVSSEVVPETKMELDFSIVIPTRDKVNLLRRCIESIERFTDSANFELIVVDNGSVDAETLSWLDAGSLSGRFRVIPCDYEFNWSKLCNAGAALASTSNLVFLNNDVEVLEHGWLDVFKENLEVTGIGAVGPMLMYPDDTIQHAGVVLGYGGIADHVYSGFPVDSSQGVFVPPTIRRSVSAITGACLAVRTEEFLRLDGFDERFRIAGDLKFCHDLMQQNLKVVYEPRVQMLHAESQSRKAGLPERELVILDEILAPWIESGDPFYNSNLSLSSLYPVPDWLKPTGII